MAANGKASKQIAITGSYQVLTVNKEWNVVTIEEKSTQGAWKTIWNYERGLIASKVPAERACFLSRMDRKEMPSMDALARLAEENRILQGQGQPKKQMTFIIKRTIRDVKSYGLDIFSMCRGLTTYIAYRDHRPQYRPSQESCTRLDVLHILGLNYCYSNNRA
ncbi:gastrokine-1-like [Phalacrocorax carbo]|uniref:gastrokine-1-like n=1 Tax=Phalacrocorax carbo TaxID=9209 RepID=UPI00311A3B3B